MTCSTGSPKVPKDLFALLINAPAVRRNLLAGQYGNSEVIDGTVINAALSRFLGSGLALALFRRTRMASEMFWCYWLFVVNIACSYWEVENTIQAFALILKDDVPPPCGWKRPSTVCCGDSTTCWLIAALVSAWVDEQLCITVLNMLSNTLSYVVNADNHSYINIAYCSLHHMTIHSIARSCDSCDELKHQIEVAGRSAGIGWWKSEDHGNHGKAVIAYRLSLKPIHWVINLNQIHICSIQWFERRWQLWLF